MRAPLPHRIFGQAALIMALICLWMSSGATLNHTDDLADFLTFRVGHSVDRHLSATLPSDPCAACQWEQTVPTLAASVPTVTLKPLFVASIAVSVPDVLHLRCFDHFGLRAPPFARS